MEEIMRNPKALLALALALAVPLASAQVTVDSTGVAYQDGVTTVGVSVGWDGDLVIAFGASDAGLPKAMLPAYVAADLAVDALGRIDPAAAERAIDWLQRYPTGIAFHVDAVSPSAVAAAFAAHLSEAGFTVVAEPDGSALRFGVGPLTYRAVFGASEAGVVVYLGS
jgi:hypothetical protein